MPERGTTNAAFILRRLKEEYIGKKLYMCFVNPEKAFERVSWKALDCAMRNNRIPKVLLGSVTSLYDEPKTRVMMVYELSDEFEVKMGMHQGSVLSPFLFAVVVDVTELAREDVAVCCRLSPDK